MIEAHDGALWGVAGNSVFRIGVDGPYTSLGALPNWANQLNRLTEGNDGNLYGTSFDGGAEIGDAGTFFRLTPDGVATLLHSFRGADGIRPTAVTQSPNGYFYGMSASGGIFKIDTAGNLTVIAGPNSTSVLYYPPSDGLILATDGNLYGINSFPQVTVFRINSDDSISQVATPSDYGFTSGSAGSLVQASDGNVYGATGNGIFQVSSDGTVTAIYAFSGKPTEVAGNVWTLAAGSDGLYGVTSAGGQACATMLLVDCDDGSTSGMIFRIDTGGGDTNSGNATGNGTVSGSIDAVDPNISALSSLLPLPNFGPFPWNPASYDVFAASLHTVAALAADGVTPVVLRFQPNANGTQVLFSIAENDSGTLGCLDLSDCPAPSRGMTTATATIQTLADGSPMAFALLQAPLDFVRPSALLADGAAPTRQVTINAVVVGSSAPPLTLKLTLWRPPGGPAARRLVECLHLEMESPGLCFLRRRL